MSYHMTTGEAQRFADYFDVLRELNAACAEALDFPDDHDRRTAARAANVRASTMIAEHLATVQPPHPGQERAEGECPRCVGSVGLIYDKRVQAHVPCTDCAAGGRE